MNLNIGPLMLSANNPDFSKDVEAIRDDLINEKEILQYKPVTPGELSDAFALLDPDLALLHKDMRTAAAQYNLAQKSGHMVDMAQWRFESAESAFQTRLTEVRKNKMLQDAALKALGGYEDDARRDLRRRSMQEEMDAAFNQRRKKMMEEKRRKEEKQNGWFFYLMLGLWLAQMNAWRRSRDMEMSHLQTAFFNARTS